MSDILVLPLGGNTCLGSTKAKQIITISTVDTSGVGGDDSILHFTNFVLLYEGPTMLSIMANGALCEDTSDVIAQELMRLPPLYEVAACLDPTPVWVMKDVPGLLHFLVSWVTRNL